MKFDRTRHLRRGTRLLVILCAGLLLAADVAAAPRGAAKRAGRSTGYRTLPPGIETAPPMARSEKETVAEHDVVELRVGVPDLAWDPKEQTPKTGTLDYKATRTMFRRGVWQLQFTFKPLRMIRVDVPQPNGKMKEKLIWYMVYRITNLGEHMTPVQGKANKSPGYDKWHDGTYTVARVHTYREMLANIGPHRFMPLFLLRSHETKKEYLDRIIPVAKERIYRREQPSCKLSDFHNTVEISEKPIPLSTGRQDNSVWGLVTWIDIDPRIDFFSIYVQGLTNAYKWVDPPGGYRKGDPPGTGRVFVRKTLQLNFSRPGDRFKAREEEIQLGIDGQVDSLWMYR